MAIAVAQVVGNNTQFNATTHTTVSVTLTVSAGSTLAVFGQWGSAYSGQGSPTTCTDSQSGTYEDGQFLSFSGIQQSAVKYFRRNVSAGSVTVTLTFAQGAQAFTCLYVAEITGTSGIMDATNAQQQASPSTSSNAVTAGPIYSSAQPALVIGYSSSLNGVSLPSAGTGFTSDLSDATTFSRVEHQRITTASGSVTPTFTVATGTSADMYTAGYVFLEGTPTGAYVGQRRHAEGTTSATTITLALNVTAGTVLHGYCCGDWSTGLTAAVTDNHGQTWTVLDTVHEPTVDNILIQQFKVANTVTGSLTITITYSASTSSRGIAVAEIFGVSSTPDVHGSNNQTPSVTTTDGTTSGSLTASGPGIILGLVAFLSATSSDVGTVGGKPGTNFSGGLSVFGGEVSEFAALMENKASGAGSVAATSTALTTKGAVSFIAVYDSAGTPGTLAAQGGGAAGGAAVLAGTGALSATGSGTDSGVGTLAGTGQIHAEGDGIATGAAQIGGSGAITAAGAGVASGGATLAGSGVLTAAGAGVGAGAATIAGVGVLSVEGDGTAAGTAILAGAGAVAALAAGTSSGAAQLAGLGQLVAEGGGAAAGLAQLAGTGDLSAHGDGDATGTATLVASGGSDLAARGDGQAAGAAVLVGIGALAAEGDGSAAGVFVLGGRGSLSAAASGIASGTATLTGGTVVRPYAPSAPSGTAPSSAISTRVPSRATGPQTGPSAANAVSSVRPTSADGIGAPSAAKGSSET